MATKYRRSQAAHRRLMEKHRDGNSTSSRVTYAYHQSVAAEQSERKRILSRSEKVSFWRRAFNYILGLHQKEKDGVMMKRARAQTARVQHTTKKPMRVNRNRYKVDTYVEDGVYNERYTVHSSHPSLKEARMAARAQEKYERSIAGHKMLHVDSAIYKSPKRYKMKKR